MSRPIVYVEAIQMSLQDVETFGGSPTYIPGVVKAMGTLVLSSDTEMDFATILEGDELTLLDRLQQAIEERILRTFRGAVMENPA
jgi:hypothetical protein